MTQVITFEDYKPSPRYDELPWTEARIEESVDSDGPWTELETITLDPVDSNPANPQSRNFTTELASDDPDLWYRIVFLDATGDVLAPTDPIQNTSEFDATTMYGSVDELFRLLKINNPTPEQITAAIRVLTTATGEIDAEIDRDVEDPIAGWEISLATEVALERAVELWRAAPFGIVDIGGDFGAAHTAKNTWERYAHMLAPLKGQWGLA